MMKKGRPASGRFFLETEAKKRGIKELKSKSKKTRKQDKRRQKATGFLRAGLIRWTQRGVVWHLKEGYVFCVRCARDFLQTGVR